MKPYHLTVVGLGRMGMTVLRELGSFPGLTLDAVLDSPESPHVGKSVASLETSFRGSAKVVGSLHHVPESTQVLVDFSSPEGQEMALQLATHRKIALVSGSTGISEELRKRLTTENLGIPLLYAGNFSVGVHIMIKVLRDMAQMLPEPFQAEIMEKHHIGKVDSPSGTALMLADAIVSGRKGETKTTFGRGQEQRLRDSSEVTVHALRLGTIPGEHTAYFAFGPEELTVTHRAGDRGIFARGALYAAEWLVGRPDGAYQMADVLRG